MKKVNDFSIEVPHNEEIDKALSKSNNEHIKSLKDVIRKQYEEVYTKQEVEITEKNKQKIEDLILATQDLIDNTIKDSDYRGNRDQNFVNLIYICHKMDLKLETYKLEEKLKTINDTSIVIQKKQNELEEQNNNLVYNLLGFLTAFSIVSASIEAIGRISGTIKIMIFMAFTILLLLTTLIALNNFYKNDNRRENKFQDNYFLWKIVLVILIILFLVLGIDMIKDNKEKIFKYIDIKIENIIENKIQDLNLEKN